MKKLTFALCIGNRGLFPETLISKARNEIKEILEKLGYQSLTMDENATRYGAVENAEEGRKFAAFLNENRGKYQGVILSLPNFSDESGAIAALQDCGVPILIHAYPDEIGKMDIAQRRDAFCGKIAIMNLFHQYNLPFTVFPPHVVNPATSVFKEQLHAFAAVCRVVNAMRRVTVGAIGARTTSFKSVRYDEITLQRYGVNTETIDLSELFSRVRDSKPDKDLLKQKTEKLKSYTHCGGVPGPKLEMLAKTGIALDNIIEEYKLDCIALRCWVEVEKELGISPCVLLGELSDRGIPAACEVDVCNAVSMYALSAASQKASACLDWNNNYGAEENKCILFHCGPVAQSMMAEKGQVIDHPMLAKICGDGCAWGCNIGRISAFPMTYTSAKTENGKLSFYLGQGEFTNDPIDKGYFGCAGVIKIDEMQKKLISIGKLGFRHHVSVTSLHVADSIREAFTTYLGYDIADI